MTTKENGLSGALRAFADEIEIIDTHEHLPQEAQRTSAQVDFTTLFSHYCDGDLVSAGLDPAGQAVLKDPQADLEHKWRVFAPYYDLIKNGSYCRAARIAMQRFYGTGDLTSLAEAVAVTEKMRRENTPGLYRRILEEACRIKKVFLFTNEEFESSYFHFVDAVDHLLHLTHHSRLNQAAAEMGGGRHTLEQYVAALGDYLAKKAARGVKGIKLTSAYYRNLAFNPVTSAEAERIFNKLLTSEHLFDFPSVHSIDNQEALLLQDYLTLRVLDSCDRLGLPVVIHTGLHAGNRNNPANARPEPLWRLFYTYPQTQFILLHGGLPWTNETAMLAKSYPNVTIDMAWMHIISPEIAVSALKTWIDLLPKNKILGFGGDYMVPEKVYGHLVMAKENITRALSEKVAEGALTENEACSWVEHLLHKNALRAYNLSG